MTSIATAHWTLVVWEETGQLRAAVQGPKTRASSAPVPEDTTFLGIRFALGTSMPWLPMQRLVDDYVEFPDVSRLSLRLYGSSLSLPDYDNAEYFVRRLVGTGALVRDLGYFDHPHLARSLTRFIGQKASHLSGPSPPRLRDARRRRPGGLVRKVVLAMMTGRPPAMPTMPASPSGRWRR